MTVSGPTALPNGQQNRDIGSPAVAGSATYANGSYTIRGAGTDIYGSADQFHFVHRQVTGNTELIARVASIADTHAWAKAGVMVRETLTANSAHAMMIVSARSGYAFQRRGASGAASSSTAGSAGAAPGWVRLVRTGNVFNAYQSTNGSTWVLVGSDTIPMAATVYVGLAVTSHNASAATTAAIDNFTVGAATGNQPPLATLTSPSSGASFTAPANITMTANASDPEGQLTRVEFFNGTTLLGSDTTAPYRGTHGRTFRQGRTR